jgi:hypothetical protein
MELGVPLQLPFLTRKILLGLDAGLALKYPVRVRFSSIRFGESKPAAPFFISFVLIYSRIKAV